MQVNNRDVSYFTPAPQYPSKIELYLKTNGAASETHWTLKNLNDSTIASGDNLQEYGVQ
ncbi:MAG: hypothetical protein U5L96_19720 [Owenweeksia sp.]|nr:hypothetical protein [Owenweeksia sp.]